MPLIHHFLYNFCDSIRGATPPSQGTSAVNSTPGMTLNGNYCQKKFGVLVVNRRYCILHVYVVSTLVRKKKSYIYQKSIWLLQNFDIFFRRKKNNINTLCLEKKKILFFTQCCARPNPDAAVACETNSFDRPVCGFLYIKCLF